MSRTAEKIYAFFLTFHHHPTGGRFRGYRFKVTEHHVLKSNSGMQLSLALTLQIFRAKPGKPMEGRGGGGGMSRYYDSSMVITLQPIQRNELVLWLVHGHHVTANPGKRVGTMARPWSSRYSQSRETSWYYVLPMVITLQPIQVNELVLWLVHGHHVTANPEKRVGTMSRPWSSRYSQSR